MGTIQHENKCDCIDKIAAATLKEVKRRNEGTVPGFELIDNECGFENVSFLPKHQLFVQYNARYTRHKKNGRTSLPATKKVNIFFTYCPFCGVKINE